MPKYPYLSGAVPFCGCRYDFTIEGSNNTAQVSTLVCGQPENILLAGSRPLFAPGFVGQDVGALEFLNKNPVRVYPFHRCTAVHSFNIYSIDVCPCPPTAFSGKRFPHPGRQHKMSLKLPVSPYIIILRRSGHNQDRDAVPLVIPLKELAAIKISLIKSPFVPRLP